MKKIICTSLALLLNSVVINSAVCMWSYPFESVSEEQDLCRQPYSVTDSSSGLSTPEKDYLEANVALFSQQEENGYFGEDRERKEFFSSVPTFSPFSGELLGPDESAERCTEEQCITDTSVLAVIKEGRQVPLPQRCQDFAPAFMNPAMSMPLITADTRGKTREKTEHNWSIDEKIEWLETKSPSTRKRVLRCRRSFWTMLRRIALGVASELYQLMGTDDPDIPMWFRFWNSSQDCQETIFFKYTAILPLLHKISDDRVRATVIGNISKCERLPNKQEWLFDFVTEGLPETVSPENFAYMEQICNIVRQENLGRKYEKTEPKQQEVSSELPADVAQERHNAYLIRQMAEVEVANLKQQLKMAGEMEVTRMLKIADLMRQLEETKSGQQEREAEYVAKIASLKRQRLEEERIAKSTQDGLQRQLRAARDVNATQTLKIANLTQQLGKAKSKLRKVRAENRAKIATLERKRLEEEKRAQLMQDGLPQQLIQASQEITRSLQASTDIGILRNTRKLASKELLLKSIVKRR